MNVDLIKTYTFDAAHSNPNGSVLQARTHGHSYVVELLVSGAVDPKAGWLIDYTEITDRFVPFQNLLDHHYLNDVDGLTQPTVEGLQQWLFQRLAPMLSGLKAVNVCIVGDCAFNPRETLANTAYDLPPALRFTFEAAHFLPAVPPTHKCRRLHGHSFRVDVAARDLAALKLPLAEVYDALAYRNLNEAAGLENPTSEHISRWIWTYLAPRVTELSVVTVAETCTARCVYHGE